jgi:predicted RNase H-like nuclease (RuvC/YqgF family)
MSEKIVEEQKLPTTAQKIKNLAKKVLGSTWNWLKDNWLVVLVVVAVAAIAIRGCEKDDAYQNLFDQYGESISDYQQQLKDMHDLQESERLEQARQLQAFIEEMNRIESEYKQEIERIDTRRQRRQTQIVREAQEDPGTLTRRIRDTFGIPIDE